MLRWQTNAAAIVAFACLVLGFASIEALQRPHSATHSVSTGQKAKAEEEDPEVATARYTKWLMVCTGVLAFATICLGLATLGLYLTGEKQIAVARQSADAAKQSADASQNAAEHIPRVERAYIFADVLYEYRQDAGAFSRVPTDNIIVCLSNYGKTPGEVSRVAISYCSYLPKSPDYSDSDLHVGIWVKAGA